MLLSQPNVITVVVIENNHTIREGLNYLLNSTEGYQCSGSFASLEEAIPLLNQELPHVLLLDLASPDIAGAEKIRQLHAFWPDLAIVVQTGCDDDQMVFNTLHAGARGYLLKPTSPVALIESIREAACGGHPVSPSITSCIIRLFRQIQPFESSDVALTPHETRLLKMLVEGHSYKSAAAELHCALNTVAFHLKNIYRKLRVHSKSEAVVKALRNRLV